MALSEQQPVESEWAADFPTNHSSYGWCWCQPYVEQHLDPLGALCEVIIHRRTAD